MKVKCSGCKHIIDSRHNYKPETGEVICPTCGIKYDEDAVFVVSEPEKNYSVMFDVSFEMKGLYTVFVKTTGTHQSDKTVIERAKSILQEHLYDEIGFENEDITSVNDNDKRTIDLKFVSIYNEDET